ncbi:MAG: hypothetical protein FWD91_03470 [Treponema sp.]|nr:hypothetical protein [Treponema sp.]
MNGSEKGGNGGGNNRKRQKRRDKNRRMHHCGEGEHSSRAGEPRKAAGHENRGGGKKDSRSFQKSHRAVAETAGRYNRPGLSNRGAGQRSGKAALFDRPKWIPPKTSTEPLPIPDCPWCGKPIQDISYAISDKESGSPVHFECVADRIAGAENLGAGEAVTYIGGGRFAVVCFSGGEVPHTPPDKVKGEPKREFTIKKIIEWEDKDKRAEWRSSISDRLSVV